MEAFKQEDFGILTDIDVRATLKQMLGQDMPPDSIAVKTIAVIV